MNRIIVAGARGFFGSAVVRILRSEGCTPLMASRRPAGDLMLDVEDRASIRNVVRKDDVIVDATAPFQKRTALLVDEAIAAGADVVDLSDSLDYARLISTRDDAARDRGVRILNACSSVSVLSSLAIQRSGILHPTAIHGFLAPATRHTANPGAAASLLASVGRPIEVLRDGELRHARGWMETRTFTALQRDGRLTEMADAFTLPRAYPSLQVVDFWVDPNTRGAGALLATIARVPMLLPIVSQFARWGGALARILGSAEGILAYEVEAASGQGSIIIFTGRESFLMAAIPAALAAIRLASGQPYGTGIVPVHQHVDTDALTDALDRYGIRIDRRVSPVSALQSETMN